MEVRFLDLAEGAKIQSMNNFSNFVQENKVDFPMSVWLLKKLSSERITVKDANTNKASLSLLDGKPGVFFVSGNIALLCYSQVLQVRGDFTRFENVLQVFRFRKSDSTWTPERTRSFGVNISINDSAKFKADFSTRVRNVVKKAAMFPEEVFKSYKKFKPNFEELVKSSDFDESGIAELKIYAH